MQATQRPLVHLLYTWCVSPSRLSYASWKVAILFCLATVVLSETVTPLDQSQLVVTTTSMPLAATTAQPKMTIASSCHSMPCASQGALPCKISVLHSYCMMRKKNETDFPDSPRELKINHKVVGNRRLFNITWRAPYDYSYKVLEGFEMLLNVWRNDTGGMPECIFFNLSGVDWARVNNIHNVLFFFDCWHEAVETDLKIRLRLSSYPRASRNSPSISSNITVSGRPNKPAEVWHPRIHWSVLANGTIFVTINPKFSSAAQYRICLENSGTCHGTASEYETRNDSVVYMVSGLDIYKSYQIWVRPEKSGVPLDEWILKKDLVIFNPPPPEPSTEHTTAVLNTPSAPENPSTFHVTIAVLATLLSLLIICGLLTLSVVKKGYFRKVFPCLLWFSCCRRQPLDILLLYINEERSPFTKFVKSHAQHLNSFVSCHFVDSTDVRNRPNPSSWLLSEMNKCHVLVYVSQSLLDCLRNAADEGSYSTTIVEAVNNLKAPRMHKKGQKAVFVLSGCDGVDTQIARHLTNTFGLPCHFVVQNENGLTLSSTCDPLHELLGTRMCPCLTCFTCIDSTDTADALLEAVRELHASSLCSTGPVTVAHTSSDHQMGQGQEQEIFLPESRGLSKCLPGDCNLSFFPCMDSGFEPDGRGSCSDVSSSPHQVFRNKDMEDTNEIEFSQDEGFECLGTTNQETISFIRPEELMSCMGSQNIEDCLARINKKSSRDW